MEEAAAVAAALTAAAAVTDSQYLYGEAARWDSKGYKPFAGERPERISPSRTSFTVNSDKFALPQREGGEYYCNKHIP